MGILNKSASKRLYYKIADKWKIPRRIPRGFMAELEQFVESKLSTKANQRGILKNAQGEFSFENKKQK